jgi:hypothetical protein
MLTRGYVLVSQPLDSVHDAVLKTCKEMNAEVIDIKRSSEIGYQIEVETDSILSRARRFQIRLQDKQSKILIDIYDYRFHNETETNFFPFFRCLAKYLRLDSGFRIYPIENYTDSRLPTYALTEHKHRLIVLPTLMEAFHYRISIINDGGMSTVKNANILGINLVKNGSTVTLTRGGEQGSIYNSNKRNR